mgnify:CR=1 FL=1
MKAVRYTHYGSADVIQLVDQPKPTPQDNQLLVRVSETIVTPSDVAGRRGSPVLLRFFTGLTRPKGTPGTDFAGVVEAIGQDVTLFQVGDRVFGAQMASAHAEYLCIAEDGVVTTLPAGMAFRETAGLCDAAMTALTFLRDVANVRPGQTVLINGASGAVGTFAVQLARYYGAEVTGVCSAANAELVRSLGARRVIDHTREAFTSDGCTYDVIFDAVGKSSFARCQNALKPGGVYMTTVPSLGIFAQMARTRLGGSRRAVFAATGFSQSREKLDFLKELLATGQLRSVVDRCYPLADIAAAHRYVEAGRKRGNLVVQVAEALP